MMKRAVMTFSSSCLLLVMSATTVFAWGWSQLSVGGANPAARQEHCAIFDPVGNRVIVFGGVDAVAETWELNLNGTPTWIDRSAWAEPVGRKDALMVFDSSRRRAILFGGYVGSSAYGNDVHVLPLDGSGGWSALACNGTPPSGRMFTAGIFDPLRDRLIVMGGHPTALNDVWALNLSPTPTWVKLSPGGPLPPERYGHSAIYDPIGDRMLVFGGSDGSADVWALSLGAFPEWSTLSPSGSGPGPRAFCSTVYSPTDHAMIVFGGSGGTGDSWRLSLGGSGEWSQIVSVTSPPTNRMYAASVWDEKAGRLLVLGGAGAVGFDVLALQGDSPPTPLVFTMTPQGGEVGDEVTITGAGLAQVTAVEFNPSVTAQMTQQTTNTLKVLVPAGASTGPIDLVHASGVAHTAEFAVGVRPFVVAVVPDSGKRGDEVELRGHHFADALGVRIGGSDAAAYQVVSDSLITAVVGPEAVTGTVEVRTIIGTGVCASQFRVLDLDWRPKIVSVRDVPGDQGGKLSVRWRASDADAYLHQAVIGYRVWRRAISASARAGRVSGVPGTSEPSVVRGGPEGYWEPLGTVPAIGLHGYAFTASTPQDSMEAGNPLTALFIEAFTADQFTHYDSAVDSGYSVDNLRPAFPGPFAVSYRPTMNALHWGASTALDLKEYRVYRGSDGRFELDEEHFVRSTRDTGMVDVPGQFTYKLVAVDVHGNSSRAGVVSPEYPVEVLASVLGVDAQPNGVRVRWYVPGGALGGASVQRSEPGGEWMDVAPVVVGSNGVAQYWDADVSAGRAYGYRLNVLDGEVAVGVGVVWVDVPFPSGGALMVSPNPSDGRLLRLRCDASRRGGAWVEVVDLSGRVMLRHGPLPAETSGAWIDVQLDRALPIGTYFVRVRGRGVEQQARLTVIR